MNHYFLNEKLNIVRVSEYEGVVLLLATNGRTN